MILSPILFALPPFSIGQTSNQPTPSKHPPRKPEGFFDFILGKVNPNDVDYGTRMQSGRDAVVANTVDDLYFWSNAVTLLLLTGSASIVLLQWRSEAKREVITAALIAELWNGRVSAGTELNRPTAHFNQLAANHNAQV